MLHAVVRRHIRSGAAVWSLCAAIAIAVLAIPSCRHALLAQAPRGADTLSPQAVADSQAVIAQLTAHLKNNQRDAAAWTRLGLAAWTLYIRAKAAGSQK